MCRSTQARVQAGWDCPQVEQEFGTRGKVVRWSAVSWAPAQYPHTEARARHQVARWPSFQHHVHWTGEVTGALKTRVGMRWPSRKAPAEERSRAVSGEQPTKR